MLCFRRKCQVNDVQAVFAVYADDIDEWNASRVFSCEKHVGKAVQHLMNHLSYATSIRVVYAENPARKRTKSMKG